MADEDEDSRLTCNPPKALWVIDRATERADNIDGGFPEKPLVSDWATSNPKKPEKYTAEGYAEACADYAKATSKEGRAAIIAARPDVLARGVFSSVKREENDVQRRRMEILGHLRAAGGGEVIVDSEIPKALRFDIGHPKTNTLYVQNPCVPLHYIVAALANERFVQEKIAAFTEIAACLGAKRIGCGSFPRRSSHDLTSRSV